VKFSSTYERLEAALNGIFKEKMLEKLVRKTEMAFSLCETFYLSLSSVGSAY